MMSFVRWMQIVTDACDRLFPSDLTLWHPLLPQPSFVIFDIRALWRSASECPDVKNYKWLLNPVWHRMLYSCTHMATAGVKGLEGLSILISDMLPSEWLVSRCWGGTAAAASPPFRPSDPALCGSCPLVTPYYCRLGDLLCYTCMLYLSTILCVYACVISVFFVFFVLFSFTAFSLSTLILLVGSFDL